MRKLYNKIIYKTPYYVGHAALALTISLFTYLVLERSPIALHAGTVFYIGREVRDWEKLHGWEINEFDYPGLIAPIIACSILYSFIG